MLPNVFLEPYYLGDNDSHAPRDSFGRFLPKNARDDRLPSGYRRSDYYRYGITDDDIAFWGLDQPGAPPPDAVWRAVMDVLEEMK